MTPWLDERREHPRVALRWPAAIRRPGEERSVQVRTLNLSCGGIYCVAQEPFQPGECLEFVLLLPEEVRRHGQVVHLHCRVSVVRVESMGPEPSWGLACRIDDYRVLVGDNGHLAARSELPLTVGPCAA